MESLHTGEQAGLRNTLTDLLQERETRRLLADFIDSGCAGDLQGPLSALYTLCKRGEHLEMLDHPAWAILYGADLSWADYTYKREQAMARIGALGRLFSAVGKDGLVIVFDEVETIDQLWNVRSRMSAYSVLGQLCRQRSVWPVFGITERFDRTVELDLCRGALQYPFATESAIWFLKTWPRGQFNVVEPPNVDARNARTLAGTIAKLYESAYGDLHADERLIERCVDEWLRNPGRNPRRLIRVLIHRMDATRTLAGVAE